MHTKDLTFFKRNEIIRGSDDYSLNGKKCMNAIYYLYQKNRKMLIGYEKRGITFMSIKFSILRNAMGLQKDNNYVAIITSAIRELQTTLIELNNWTNPITKVKYKWYSTKFLNDANIEYKNQIYVNIEISTLFKQLMSDLTNFTRLDLIKYMNKFRTKYAMKIYEYLSSFKAYNYLDITQNHMMKLLNIDENDKNYKYYSKLTILVERQLNEISKKTDLDKVQLLHSKLLAKEKIFRIKINPKSKKISDKIEVKTVLENLIKRF